MHVGVGKTGRQKQVVFSSNPPTRRGKVTVRPATLAGEEMSGTTLRWRANSQLSRSDERIARIAMPATRSEPTYSNTSSRSTICVVCRHSTLRSLSLAEVEQQECVEGNVNRSPIKSCDVARCIQDSGNPQAIAWRQCLVANVDSGIVIADDL